MVENKFTFKTKDEEIRDEGCQAAETKKHMSCLQCGGRQGIEFSLLLRDHSHARGQANSSVIIMND